MMKYIYLTFLLLICALVTQGQNKGPVDNVIITSEKGKTRVVTNEKGELQVNVSPKNVVNYQEKFPYVKTKEVILRNVTTVSGKALRISDNPFMFRDVKITTEQ